MGALPMRYTRNFDAEFEISDKRPMTKEQIKRALIERRAIIGPNGERFEIPRHMSFDDMMIYFRTEFGLTRAEISQVLAAAELLTTRPDYRGKLNRVVIDGASNPLRIEIPQKIKHTRIEEQAQEVVIPKIEPVQQIEPVVIERKPKVELGYDDPDMMLDIFFRNPSRDRSKTNYTPSQRNATSLQRRMNPSRDIDTRANNANVIPFDKARRPISRPTTNTYIVQQPDNARRNQNNVNAIIADRMRAERAEERKREAQRAEQNKDLEKQMREHYKEQARISNRKRKNRMAVACLVAMLWVTGFVIDIAETARDTAAVRTNIEQTGDYQPSDSLFNVTPSTVAYFTNGIDLLPSSQRTNDMNVTTLNETQTPVSRIDESSQGLAANTNLTNVLNRYSMTSENPVVVGEIASYQEFEQLLQNGGDALYTSGPAYFANFSRQMLHGLLKDKYGAEKVSATYEKTGENNQNYEFYIRYYKSGSSSERTPEGKVIMTRNAEGRLQTKEYHTLPNEVYEMLAMIGEFSDFTNSENGLPFDVQGYADRFTNGDVQRAREELKERMTYGVESMQKLLTERVRAEQVDYYRYGR